MNETLTKEKSKEIFVILEEFFKKEKIVYYKREEEDFVFFILPYSAGLKHKTLYLDINITITKNSNLCRMGFSKTLNSKINFSKVLLDMNSELIDGNLSVISDSDKVSFNINFVLYEGLNVKSEYEKYLYQCLRVFIKLYEKQIINIQSGSINE